LPVDVELRVDNDCNEPILDIIGFNPVVEVNLGFVATGVILATSLGLDFTEFSLELNA